MKFVLDTNVLITFFWKNSVFQKLIKKEKIDCIAPEYALEEINKYKKDICMKTKISEKEFKELLNELAIYVLFVPVEEYQKVFKKVIKTIPDQNDLDFISLAYVQEMSLWSNNKDLQNQNLVLVYTTKDVLSLLEESYE